MAAASLEFLSMVRWGAANALTASLPDDQREELLKRMVTQRASGGDGMEGRSPSDAGVNGVGGGYAPVGEESVPGATPASPLSPRDAWMQGRGSIQEEIAITLAEEARLKEEEGYDWEDDADEISRKIEDAAKKRIESEFLIQKIRFDEELKKVEFQSMSESGVGASLVENDVRMRGDQIELEREKMTQLEQDIDDIKRRRGSAVEAYANEYRQQESYEDSSMAFRNADAYTIAPPHPILGPVLCDLGYKQIYLVPADNLGTIPVWNKNRIYRHRRAQSMALDKLQSMQLGFPGVVCLHEDLNGKLSILDGQHRVGMMAALKEERQKQADAMGGDMPILDHERVMFDQVLVEVYRQDPTSDLTSHEHAQAVFLEINKSEPIKLVDVPGVASNNDRKVITEAVDLLRAQYPKMFSASQNCYLPNVNEDNLRNNIFGANILNRHKLNSSEDLFQWLLLQNTRLEEKYQANEYNERTRISERAWGKTAKYGFYLGLESNWLYK